MTMTEARRLYVGAGGPDDHQPSEWDSIHREMEAIVAAKSDRAAGRTIDWWGCWDRKYTATAFARKVRELHTANAQISGGTTSAESDCSACFGRGFTYGPTNAYPITEAQEEPERFGCTSCKGTGKKPNSVKPFPPCMCPYWLKGATWVRVKGNKTCQPANGAARSWTRGPGRTVMFDELTDFLRKYQADSITITVKLDSGAIIEVRRLDPGDRMKHKLFMLTEEEIRDTFVQPSTLLRFVGEQWAREVGT